MKTLEYPIVPVPKPRMTQRDKWQKRPAVMRYRAFCDEVRARGINLPESDYHVIFVMPMPKSWSKKKQAEMDGKPHQQKPDKDNLEKPCWTPSLTMIHASGMGEFPRCGAPQE